MATAGSDTLSTHGLVAGLFNAVYALGETAGAAAGGWMYDKYGFPRAMAACSCMAGDMNELCEL